MKSLCVIALLLPGAVLVAGAPGQNKRVVPKYLHGVGIDQNLNAELPLDAQFTDESGHAAKFGDYLGRRPVILALVYYTCPMLCDRILDGLVRGLRPLSLSPGKDFDVVAISINPDEGPRRLQRSGTSM